MLTHDLFAVAKLFVVYCFLRLVDVRILYVLCRHFVVILRSHENATYTRGGKICDFRLKSPFVSKTVQNRPMERY